MGIVSNQRGARSPTTQEALPTTNANSGPTKKRWSNLMPLCVALVVIAEIAFLGRLDMVKNAALVDSWADVFYRSPPRELAVAEDDLKVEVMGSEQNSELQSCEEWLEKQDAVGYKRDFQKDPISLSGDEQEFKYCAVGCKFGLNPRKLDAAIGLPHQAGTAGVLRSMESVQYYAENNIAQARRWCFGCGNVGQHMGNGFGTCHGCGEIAPSHVNCLIKLRRGYDILMTTSLSSDVPVGYFSWAEYDIMAPVQPKTEGALAAAFISNCVARNFRLQALEGLEKANIKIDSYGGCHRNHDGNVEKVETLKHYKFSLAFENSNEEDYVTEKFFQSLVAGTIPVVVGAPNIEEFSPFPRSLLHIKQLEDVDSVAKTMKYLAENPDAYNQSLRWKYEGPTDSFKALVDMAAVHSSCRLCIHLATAIQEKEEKSPEFKKRPCKCTKGSGTIYHLFVRERGRFEMESIFLRSGNLTLEALESEVLVKFKSLKYIPVWKQERPESIRGGDELKIHRIYPVGMTQRQALYTFRFRGEADFRSHVESNPCAKFEVIFV